MHRPLSTIFDQKACSFDRPLEGLWNIGYLWGFHDERHHSVPLTDILAC